VLKFVIIKERTPISRYVLKFLSSIIAVHLEYYSKSVWSEGSRNEWYNIVWMTPCTSEMRNLIAEVIEKPL
jgi:hypothetical protein